MELVKFINEKLIKVNLPCKDEVLRELMDLIQREDLVKQIIRATSQEDIENILNKLQSV